MSDPLIDYLREAEQWAAMPWPERHRLLVSARTGNEADKRRLIQACLLDVARIAVACEEPKWVADVQKIQEANLVLMRCIDDPSVDDLRSAMKQRIQERLRVLSEEDPPELV